MTTTTQNFNTITGTPAYRIAQYITGASGEITVSFQVGVVVDGTFTQLAAPAHSLTATEAAEVVAAVSADAVAPMLTQLQNLTVAKLRALGRINF